MTNIIAFKTKSCSHISDKVNLCGALETTGLRNKQNDKITLGSSSIHPHASLGMAGLFFY